MKRIVFISGLFLTFTGLICLAKTGSDSLMKALKTTSNDTSQINILYKITTNFLYTYPDSAEQYVNLAMGIAKRSNNPVALAKAYNLEGNFLRFKTRYPESLQDYLKSKEICEQLGLKKLECQN